ncbi:MAG: CPBP family intramembrane glutamic endopeptidase [Planctomycetota bacterium]
MSQPDETEETTQTPDSVLFTAVGVEAGLGILAIVLGAIIGPGARDLIPSPDANGLPAIWGGLGLGVLATIPLLIFIGLVRRIDHPAVRELEVLGDHPMIRTMLRLGPMELLLISLCAGVGEELLFRGWLMPLLAGEDASLVASDAEAPVRWWASGGWLGSANSQDISWLGFTSWLGRIDAVGLGIAWITSSILFGMFHPISKLYIVLTGVMGLYFGLLIILTGNLLIPITAHALYDAVQLWSAAAQMKAEPDDTN